ncbi:MAG: DNA mismatch repair endonuclease MutL [Eubacteriales bacterium]|nr:DNA mismatch repair endonuclease MutL [Eubacteriales bacterium]
MIRLLSKETIDKIAAGEVVERPANVVKELIDNAVDSGARAVSVEIRRGGVELIRVTDNGCGIAGEEIPIAFVRHATSKLTQAEDLESILTMGFRGEALASICGVSRVELITKRKEDITGHRYLIEGGIEKSLKEIGVPDGTTIIVRDLFYNVPVRRDFLKSANQEGTAVRDIVEKMALSFPHISFSFVSDGKALFHTTGNGKLRDVIYTVYGGDTVRELIEVSAKNETMSLEGYIAKPLMSRSKRDYEIYFVNGRHVRSKVIDNAIETAYDGYLMQHKFPFTILKLTIDPGKIDVNIHPKKSELRFSDDFAVSEFVYESVLNALRHREHIAEAVVEKATTAREIQKETAGLKAEPFQNKAIELLKGKLDEITAATRHESKTSDEGVTDKAYGSDGTGFGTSVSPGFSTSVSSGNVYDSNYTSGNALNASSYGEVNNYNNNSVNKVNDGITNVISESGSCAQNELKGTSHDAQPNTVGNGYAQTNINTNGQAQINEASNTNAGYGAQFNNGNNTELNTNHTGKSTAFFTQDNTYEQIKLDTGFLSKESRPYYRFLGQVFDTYWIIEYNNALFLIDQHAAHEKVNYERLMKKVKAKEEAGEMDSQMIIPVLMTLSAQEALSLRNNLSVLHSLGFEIDEDSDNDFIVRAVPASLPELSSKELLTELIDTLSEERNLPRDPEVLKSKIASMSCKAAVKGNNSLSEAEMRYLIDELLTLDDPYNCPHGRPVIVRYSRADLDRMFKRIL